MASRSPFPGMDPYLEGVWGDVHLTLIVYDVDYTQPCRPPLEEADAAELARRLASGE